MHSGWSVKTLIVVNIEVFDIVERFDHGSIL